MDGIPNCVHCSVLRNGNHTLHQESWDGPSKFGGSGPPPTSQWLRPWGLVGLVAVVKGGTRGNAVPRPPEIVGAFPGPTEPNS